MKKIEGKDYYDTREAAAELNCTKDTVCAYCKNKRLKHIKMGGLYYVEHTSLLEMKWSKIPSYSTKEIADKIHTTDANVIGYIRRNQLKAEKVKNKYLIAKNDGDKFIADILAKRQNVQPSLFDCTNKEDDCAVKDETDDNAMLIDALEFERDIWEELALKGKGDFEATCLKLGVQAKVDKYISWAKELGKEETNA